MRAGKFKNLDELSRDAAGFDWLLVVVDDDDVVVPARFPGHAIELVERLDLYRPNRPDTAEQRQLVGDEPPPAHAGAADRVRRDGAGGALAR